MCLSVLFSAKDAPGTSTLCRLFVELFASSFPYARNSRSSGIEHRTLSRLFKDWRYKPVKPFTVNMFGSVVWFSGKNAPHKAVMTLCGALLLRPSAAYFFVTIWSLSLYILLAGTTPRTLEVGYMFEPRHTTVPGLSTLLQPTSTLSPSIAPNFLRPVSMGPPGTFTVTRVLSLFTLLVIEPAPMWALNPSTESPT